MLFDAASSGKLATGEVRRLDAGRAFIDRRDAGVAQRLRRARVLDEAHAAVHLDAEVRNLKPALRAAALDDRNEQVSPRLRAAALASKPRNYIAAALIIAVWLLVAGMLLYWIYELVQGRGASV